MCRRRFFKSYFYINYGGQSHGVTKNYGGPAHGETFSVSPFVAGGGPDTIELVSARPWAITNNISWLTISKLSDKSGTYLLTLTASENQSLDERTGSFTAKTLDDRFSIVVSVSQQPKASTYYIYVTPQEITLDAEDTYDALDCALYKDNGTLVEHVTPIWTVEGSNIISVDANGVVNSNNQTAEPVNGIKVWAKYTYEGEELWDSATVNVRAAQIQRFITVSPQSVSMEATGTRQLTVTYHEIINNHETTTDVTNSSNYTGNSQVITVNGTGLISANNQSEDPATATITVTYDSVPSVNVPVTANSASVEYRNLTVSPTEMTLNTAHTSNGVKIHAYVDEYINGQPTGVIVEVTSAATWNSNHTDVATVTPTGNDEVVKPVYGSGYFPDTRYATATTQYLGSAATCVITVEPEGRIEKYITVSPTSASIGATGTQQLTVILHTVVDGVETTRNITSDADTDYSSDNTPIITVSDTGLVTANNQGDAPESATITVSYPGVQDAYAEITASRANVEYRNLTVSPTEMILNTAHTSNGAEIHAYVDEYINGNPTGNRIEVTFENGLTWNSDDTSVATVSKSGSKEVVKSVYGSGFFPDNRYATVTASYLNSAATCDVTVEPEGYVDYILEVSPESATLGYGETTGLTVTYYQRIDGVKQGNGTAVTTTAQYQPNNSAATINAGTVTGNNTGNTSTSTTITISYGQASNVQVVITSNPAGRRKVLIVTATPSSIGPTGTSQLSAVYQELIGNDVVYEETPNPTAVTWSVTAGSQYVDSLSDAGVLKANNDSSDSSVTVKINGSYNGATGTTNVTVQKRVITYTDLRYASGSSILNASTITSVSLASAASKNNVYVLETSLINGGGGSTVDDTPYATFNLYSGQTWLAEFTCGNSSSEVYDDNYLTITYTAGKGLTFTSTNTTEEVGKTYRLNAADDSMNVNLGISIAAAAHVPVTAYTSIFYVSGDVNTVITTLSLASAQTKNKVFVYEDEEIDGQHNRYINDTTNATYTLYSGGTQLGTFGCTSTGQKYSDANLTITYNGASNGLVFESSNTDQSKVQKYTLTVTDNGLSEDLDITIAVAESTSANIGFGTLTLIQCSNLSIYDLTNMKLSAFTVFDGNGHGISSNTLNIGTLNAHEDYNETTVGWRSNNFTTTVGETLSARLYFYFNGGGEDMSTTAAIWVGESQIYGTRNEDLSTGGYEVFDFNLGTVQNAGSINYGNVDIIFGIEGGEGKITVTCLDKHIDNTGGTSEFTVTWRDMAENGTIAIRCTGESGTVVLRHTMNPTTFTGAEGTGRVYVELGQNSGDGGRFYVSGSGIDFAGNNKLASDYGEQEGHYVPPVGDCNFVLSYTGQSPVPYDGTATFKLYYGDDVDTSTIGVIQQNPVIDEISLVDVTAGEMNVIVDLLPNCNSTNRTFPFTLSAQCGNETVTASNSTVEQGHQQGYPITVSNNVYALVINNTSQDIYLNGLQVYSRNDCSSVNLYQFPYAQSEMIPANSQKQIMSVIGGTTRDNDTQIWGDWNFSNLPQNSYSALVAGGFQIAEPGIAGAADVTRATTITPGNIILQVRMLN